jgi:hypothetical protein
MKCPAKRERLVADAVTILVSCKWTASIIFGVSLTGDTEQVGSSGNTCIWKMPRLNTGSDMTVLAGFYGFPQSPKRNTWVVP